MQATDVTFLAGIAFSLSLIVTRCFGSRRLHDLVLALELDGA
jgi:hypothetical protein